MTQRGQWYDFSPTRTGKCTVGVRNVDCCQGKKTHIVKWADSGDKGRLRHHTCADHAARIVAFQTKLGADVRAYRYRKD